MNVVGVRCHSLHTHQFDEEQHDAVNAGAGKGVGYVGREERRREELIYAG